MFSGLTLKSEYLPSVCIGGWQATQKPEMLAGRVCQWLADNTKISHKRELIVLRYYNSLFDLEGELYMKHTFTKKEALRIVTVAAKDYGTYCWYNQLLYGLC